MVRTMKMYEGTSRSAWKMNTASLPKWKTTKIIKKSSRKKKLSGKSVIIGNWPVHRKLGVPGRGLAVMGSLLCCLYGAFSATRNSWLSVVATHLEEHDGPNLFEGVVFIAGCTGAKSSKIGHLPMKNQLLVDLVVSSLKRNDGGDSCANQNVKLVRFTKKLVAESLFMIDPLSAPLKVWELPMKRAGFNRWNMKTAIPGIFVKLWWSRKTLRQSRQPWAKAVSGQ